MEELAGKSAYMRQIESDRQKMKPMITDLTEQVCVWGGGAAGWCVSAGVQEAGTAAS